MISSRTITHLELTDWTRRILQTFGSSAQKAQLVAESLVAANLRGVDSHGVHLLPYYVKHLEAGSIKPESDGRVVRESAACVVCDGEQAYGQVVSELCCGHAIRLAQAHGLSMVVARNSNHFGAAAFWGQRLSGAGLIGVVMTNASASVPPWQGKQGRVGTNPICVSMPTSGKGAWLLDMATTTVAMNKVLRAQANNEPNIPAGWAMDEDGVPTTETEKARLPMPLGGYKGSGLGLMVEILSGVLGGGAMSTELGGTYLFDRKMDTSHTFLAIDPVRFLPDGELQPRMERLITLIKGTPPAKGFDEVLVAGDPEWQIESERLETGIPIDDGTWDRFETIAHARGVEMPAGASR